MIIKGDSLEVLKTLENNSIDSIVSDLEKTYEILKCGKLINKETCKELKFSPDHKGYLKARVYLPNFSKHSDKRKPMRLHRIVAMKYLKDFSHALQVNHINGIKTDNRIENLEMVTNAQNAKHGWALPQNKMRIYKLNRINGRFANKVCQLVK